MLKAISYWSIPGGLDGTCPIEDAMKQAKAAKLDGIELAVGETGVLTPGTDKAACTAYKKAAQDHGLALETLASGMSWGCSPSHIDAKIRQKSIKLHRDALKRAAWLGCSSMLFVPGAILIPWDPSYPAVPYDQAVEWARHAVTELAKTAEDVGVELCVENVWNGLFYSPLELRDFVDSIGSKSVGVYFDAGNVLGYHQHPQHWISILGKRIRRVHVKDFKRSVGSLAGFCELMEGDMPWKEVMAALRKVGYDRTIVAEMIPPAEGLLKRTAKALEKIVAM